MSIIAIKKRQKGLGRYESKMQTRRMIKPKRENARVVTIYLRKEIKTNAL